MGRSKKLTNTGRANRVQSKMLADKLNKPPRQNIKDIRAASHSRTTRRGG